MRYDLDMSKSNKPRNPDHVRRTNRPSPDNAVISERLKTLLTPAVFGQLAYYRSLGLRDRLLGLPVMVAASALRVRTDAGAGPRTSVLDAQGHGDATGPEQTVLDIPGGSVSAGAAGPVAHAPYTLGGAAAALAGSCGVGASNLCPHLRRGRFDLGGAVS